MDITRTSQIMRFAVHLVYPNQFAIVFWNNNVSVCRRKQHITQSEVFHDSVSFSDLTMLGWLNGIRAADAASFLRRCFYEDTVAVTDYWRTGWLTLEDGRVTDRYSITVPAEPWLRNSVDLTDQLCCFTLADQHATTRHRYPRHLCTYAGALKSQDWILRDWTLTDCTTNGRAVSNWTTTDEMSNITVAHRQQKPTHVQY